MSGQTRKGFLKTVGFLATPGAAKCMNISGRR